MDTDTGTGTERGGTEDTIPSACTMGVRIRAGVTSPLTSGLGGLARSLDKVIQVSLYVTSGFWGGRKFRVAFIGVHQGKNSVRAPSLSASQRPSSDPS